MTLAIKSIKEHNFSIFRTLFWMLFLASGIQVLVSFISAVGMSAYGLSIEQMEQASFRPDFLAIVGFISALLIYPFIKIAAHQDGQAFPYHFLNFKPVNKSTLIKVLFSGIIYYAFALLLSNILAIETPKFMLDIKAQTHSSYDMLMLVIGICIVAPIVEEVIFRGLGYARLVQSKAGITGAIIITSILFTIIHVQYDAMVLCILSIFAFLLGYVRYKTGNLIYCIALHMLLNSLSTIELFLLT